jgi:hypothetical protein
MLELSNEAREQVQELKVLSEKVQNGEEGARTELRRAVRESAPEVVARCSDTTRTYRHILAGTASGGNPLVQEAVAEQARLMALELAGENPTPLEMLLSERVGSLWLLIELQEALGAAWYNRENDSRPSATYMLKMARLLESSHRRYLAAIMTLARVQKLRGPSRVQVNIGENQVNVSR